VELIDQVPLLDISAAPMNTHISLCGVFLVILFLSYTIIHWVVHLSIIAKVDLCFDTAFFSPNWLNYSKYGTADKVY
jgi:hypothetical protein